MNARLAASILTAMLSAILAPLGPASAQAPTAPDKPATAPSEAMPAVLDLTTEQILSRAEQHRARKEFQEAQNTLDVALKRGDRTVEVLILSAQIAEDREDLQSARNWYLEARRLAGEDFRANIGLGRINSRVSYWRQATTYLEAAERVAPPDKVAEVQALLAKAYNGLRQMDKAITAAEKAITADSSNVNARTTMIGLRLTRGEFDKALADVGPLIQLCQRQVEDNRGDEKKLRQLAEAYDTRLAVLREYHNAQYERGIDGRLSDKITPGQERKVASLQRQIVETRVYQAELSLILTYFEIIPIAEKSVENDATDLANLTQLALLYRNTSQDQRAAELLQKILDLDPQNRAARAELDALRSLAAPSTAPARSE